MTSAIELKLQEAVSSGRFLGVSFIVADKDGNTIYSGAHGRRSFQSDEPMTLSTSGWLASMTKLQTAVAALLAVQQGLVTLDEDVAYLLLELRDKKVLASYDPDTKIADWDDVREKITLRRLLTHSAGFVYPHFTQKLGQWAQDNDRAISKLTGDFKKDWDRPLAFQPGTDWGYGEGLDWAGKVVEKASGRSLGEYLEEHVWIPLKMTGTTFHPEQRGEYQLLEMGQRKDGRGSRLVANPGQHYPVPALNEAGGAGLFSNAEDYSKLLAALLRDDGVLLKKEIIEELMKPQLNDAGKGALKREREKWVLQEIPREVPVDYALGGLVTTGDVPGGRPKGAVAWDGFSNSNWLLDRGTGISMVFVTQVLPDDPDTKELWKALEREVYALVAKRG